MSIFACFNLLSLQVFDVTMSDESEPPFEFDELISDAYTDDPLIDELNKHIPNESWSTNFKRRRCVQKVASRTLSQSSTIPITERRKRAQEQVAMELGVKKTTVNDHCGRQLFEERASDPRNQWIKRFDNVLSKVEADRNQE